MIRNAASTAAGLCLMAGLTALMVAVLRVVLWRQLRAADRRLERVRNDVVVEFRWEGRL